MWTGLDCKIKEDFFEGVTFKLNQRTEPSDKWEEECPRRKK